MISRNTRGITRTVFLVGRYAIKVPSWRMGWRFFLRGLLANMQEREFGRAGWDGLCPVLYGNRYGFVIVMPRADPIERDMTDVEYDDLLARREYELPVERKTDSFGMLNGQIVAVDYGN